MIHIFENQSFDQPMILFSQCAKICRDECIVYIKYNSLNSGLWMLFVSMFLLTLFYFTDRNEEALRKVSEWTKQEDIEHVRNTLRWLLFIGIGFIILYIAIFLLNIKDINPIR